VTKFVQATLRWQRWLLAATLVLSAVAVVPPAIKPFMLPKATVVVVGALALVALATARWVWERQLRLPRSPVTTAVTAFAVALVVATASSGSPWTSVIGAYDRYNGLVPYLAYLVVFVAVVTLADPTLVRLLTRTALVALGMVVGYGLLQAVGADRIGWTAVELGRTFSTFGNVDFSAAWAAAVSALTLTTMLSQSERRAWRVYAALLLPMTLVYLFLTGTSQGPVVALVALFWAGMVLVIAPGSWMRGVAARNSRRALGVSLGAATLLGIAVVAMLPLLRAQLDQALVERPAFWAAAVQIFADHPVVGTGLGTYGHHFLAYRPESHAVTYGNIIADVPHSVPLAMFANGGLLLGLSYLLAIILVGFVLVRALLRPGQSNRSTVAGFGGVWLGYQAQSMISYDAPPLAVLHWLSAGVIVATAAPPRWREVRLPGSAPSRAVDKRGRKRGPLRVPTSTRVLHGMIGLFALAAAWVTLYPLRADVLAATAGPLSSSGRVEAAIQRLNDAAQLNPAEPSYVFQVARVHESIGDDAQAAAAAAEAAHSDPGSAYYALYAGWQADVGGEVTAATSWYREAASRDPRNPAVLTEVAAFFLEEGKTDVAEEYAARALALDPNHAKAREQLDAVAEQQ
jgi:O-antigen ligase